MVSVLQAAQDHRGVSPGSVTKVPAPRDEERIAAWDAHLRGGGTTVGLAERMNVVPQALYDRLRAQGVVIGTFRCLYDLSTGRRLRPVATTDLIRAFAARRSPPVSRSWICRPACAPSPI